MPAGGLVSSARLFKMLTKMHLNHVDSLRRLTSLTKYRDKTDSICCDSRVNSIFLGVNVYVHARIQKIFSGGPTFAMIA